MGNIQAKSHSKVRNKKQVHWRAAALPSVPGKPTLLPNVDDNPDLINLRWTPPAINGGSPISGYIVEHRRIGSPHWVRATPLPVPFPEITLSGLEPGWRYQFRISAENAVGCSDFSELSEPITVTLQKSAVAAPQFTQEITDIVSLENEKCEFVAHYLGQPPPKVCWFKDGFEIFSSRRIRILSEYDRSVLTIHQTSISDEGEIKCTLTNRIGHTSCKAKLTVEAPPSIRLPKNYENGLLFEIGEIIRLKVSIFGRPAPLVFWTHNGESLQGNEHYEIENEGKTSTVKIMEAKRCDRGEYQVRALNKLGESITSFLVTVTDKPSPPGQARVVMTLGRSVTLSWNKPVDDGGCKIGNYIIEYYRMGWDVWLKAATSRQLTTSLGELIEGSEYKFRIKAESPYGISDPGDESDVVFIPDSRRGINNTSTHTVRSRNILDEIQSPQSKRSPRSHSSSRIEQQLHTAETTDVPQRPKRSKTKSQPQSCEPSPRARHKELYSHINETFLDRASIARELAYGASNNTVKKEIPSIETTTPSEKNIPKTEHSLMHINDEPEIILNKNSSSVTPKRKLIREHSGSSEFMLVLYSDENENEQSQLFSFDNSTVPPPLSLSAPELGGTIESQFIPIRNSASSNELLHERTLARLYETGLEEKNEKKFVDMKKISDISKKQIHLKGNSNDFTAVDPRHLHRSKLSSNNVTGQYKYDQLLHTVDHSKSPREYGILPKNLKDIPPSFSMTAKKDGNEIIKLNKDALPTKAKPFEKKLYSQNSFEKKEISVEEEKQWIAEYEESISESDSESEFSDMERFKFDVRHTATVQPNEEHCDKITSEDSSDYIYYSRNEPFEILTKRKELPDPNFTPKPILKKSDVSNITPTTSPPLSPASKTSSRSLSPRPDFVLKRNRSNSLAVPTLSVLSFSEHDEIDQLPISSPSQSTFYRNRSLSFDESHHNNPDRKQSLHDAHLKTNRKSPTRNLSSISKVAEITAITAASIVIPGKLLDKRIDSEANKIVADHYDDIVKSVNDYRKQGESSHLDRNFPKSSSHPSTESLTMGNNSNNKEQSKENLSQDSGYHSSMMGNCSRRDSFTDHTDIGKFKNDNHSQYENLKLNLLTSQNPSSTNTFSKRNNRKQLSNPRTKSPHSSKRGTSVVRKSTNQSENNHDKNLDQMEFKTDLPTRKPPMLKEIMTQTSECLESFPNMELKKTNTDKLSRNAELLSAKAEIQVRGLVEWLTDLALFAVACWLYLFNNELLALPILFCMIYRQLKEEFKKYLPKWIKKKFNGQSS